jgi:FkbM family methyltransferase
MKNLTNCCRSLLFRLGRTFPTPARRVLVSAYLFWQSQVSRFDEFRKLSDFPKKLSPSKRSIRGSVKFDLYTIAVKYQLNINSVCHVGAHKGQEIADYLKLGVKFGVFIEPVPENYLILESVVSEIVGYRALNFVVGNHEGLIKFNLGSNDYQSSSVLQPLKHLKEAPQVSFDRVIESRISTLDNILPKSEVWDLIVIDVQGYELKVLQGSTKTLEKCNYIFIEVNRAETYQDCAQITEVDEFLLQQGFKRVLTRWWTSWGDALYVRITLLPIDTVAK